ncbi:MAG: hypothetical protein OQL08_06480 [Gammaproteobacteria bacterium]|nr:hypothetical protein [Gammaproteobacteria bacterium]
MKKVATTALLLSLLLAMGGSRAADFNYSGLASGSSGSSMGGVMGAMWEFMEWFLDRRNTLGRSPGGWGVNQGPVPATRNPYRYRDYWDDPANPWVDMQPLEGVWRAQSGELWYVRQNRFVLVDSQQQRMAGEFLVEGNFILTRMPWGEVEFEFRQMDDVLVLRDVNGRVMLLRRVEAGDWSW